MKFEEALELFGKFCKEFEEVEVEQYPLWDLASFRDAKSEPSYCIRVMLNYPLFRLPDGIEAINRIQEIIKPYGLSAQLSSHLDAVCVYIYDDNGGDIEEEKEELSKVSIEIPS